MKIKLISDALIDKRIFNAFCEWDICCTEFYFSDFFYNKSANNISYFTIGLISSTWGTVFSTELDMTMLKKELPNNMIVNYEDFFCECWWISGFKIDLEDGCNWFYFPTKNGKMFCGCWNETFSTK